MLVESACRPRVFFDDTTERVKDESQPFRKLFFFFSNGRDTFARISSPRLDRDSRSLFLSVIRSSWLRLGKGGTNIHTREQIFTQRCRRPPILVPSLAPPPPPYRSSLSRIRTRIAHARKKEKKRERERERESLTEISLFRW